jgi:hypothetical protein
LRTLSAFLTKRSIYTDEPKLLGQKPVANLPEPCRSNAMQGRKRAPERPDTRHPSLPANFFQGKIRHKKQLACTFQANLRQHLFRALTSRGPENAIELRGREAGAPGDFIYSQGTIKVRPHEMNGSLDCQGRIGVFGAAIRGTVGRSYLHLSVSIPPGRMVLVYGGPQ